MNSPYKESLLTSHLDKFQAAFLLAQFDTKRWHPINNCYLLPGPDTPPWYLVETAYGLIKIGWRKKVIQIDWETTDVPLPRLTQDEVTKGDYDVHAWGYAKLVEYLILLRQGLANAVAVDNQ